MAVQMRDMAEASRDVERSKIEVHLKVFSEQMEYYRERDRRYLDNAGVANLNARLAIEKQGDVVQCLSQLANVLSARLRLPKAVQAGLEPGNQSPDSNALKNMADTDAVDPPSTSAIGTNHIPAASVPGL